jgi:hypothetical protein
MTTARLSLFEQFHALDPSRDDEHVVIAISQQILRDADATPPVDVAVLASVCGITDIEYRRQLWAGVLFSRSGKPVAQIRDSDGLERQRFTVLHEGGHTFLPGFLRAAQHRCKGPKTREEQLCDLAAAEMLLPREFFHADLGQAGPGLRAVEELAAVYIASIQATAVRTVTLAAESTLLLAFHYANKPSERGRERDCPRKLRLEWSMRHGIWPYPLRDKSVSRHSPIARAWEFEPVNEIANIDELLGSPIGPVRVDARRYGDRVLAIVRRLGRRYS